MNTTTRLIFAISLSIACISMVYSKEIDKQLPHIYYINIPVQTANASWQLSAQYRLPRGTHTSPLPAVIILHSSSGIDSTGQFYAKALNNASIATLELDLWGARNLQGGSGSRPASPQETLPDVFSALHYLVQQENIDAERIGVIGFSWGGVLSMLTATEQYMAMTGTPFRFAGHIAHYPVCWLYNNPHAPGFEFNNLTGAPVLIQTGGLDDYDLPDTCQNMVANLDEQDEALVDVNIFEGAYHAWDRLEPTWLVTDPFSHLGQGGEVTLSPNKWLAKKSRRNVVNFFSEIFEIEQENDD